MGVIRIQHNNNYTVMANWHLRDKQLSLKAKGLMSYMLSLPDDWDYSINGLAYVCNCGRDMIRSGLVELEALGYLQRDRHRNACGQLVNTDYILYEHPRLQNTIVSEQTKHNQDKLPELKKPRLEKPRLEKPTLDFPIQLNTNISNNVYKQVLSA